MDQLTSIKHILGQIAAHERQWPGDFDNCKYREILVANCINNYLNKNLTVNNSRHGYDCSQGGLIGEIKTSTKQTKNIFTKSNVVQFCRADQEDTIDKIKRTDMFSFSLFNERYSAQPCFIIHTDDPFDVGRLKECILDKILKFRNREKASSRDTINLSFQEIDGLARSGIEIQID